MGQKDVFSPNRGTQKRIQRPLEGPLCHLGINIPKNRTCALKRTPVAVVAIIPQKKGKKRPVAATFCLNGKIAATEAKSAN